MAETEHTKDRAKNVLKSRSEMCLDFANTLAYRGSTPSESLHEFGDLLKWCGDATVIPPRLIQELRGWQQRHPKRAADIFEESVSLREVIYRVFHAIASSSYPEQADLDLLNRGLQAAPARNAVQRDGEGFGWRAWESKISAPSILAAVLWSSGDLLTGPQLAKLRECSNEKCL